MKIRESINIVEMVNKNWYLKDTHPLFGRKFNPQEKNAIQKLIQLSKILKVKINSQLDRSSCLIDLEYKYYELFKIHAIVELWNDRDYPIDEIYITNNMTSGSNIRIRKVTTKLRSVLLKYLRVPNPKFKPDIKAWIDKTFP